MSYLPRASGGIPGGSDSQIQFNTAGAFDGSANLQWFNNIQKLDVKGYIETTPLDLTGSANTPSLQINQTWNTTGVPKGIFLNITDTASNGASLLADFQVNNLSMFSIGKGGVVNSRGAFVCTTPGGWFQVANSFVLEGTGVDGNALLHATNGIAFSNLTVLALKTGAPAAGTAQFFKVGSAASVTPTAPNRTIQVDIAGTVYYLHGKTTND